MGLFELIKDTVLMPLDIASDIAVGVLDQTGIIEDSREESNTSKRLKSMDKNLDETYNK